MSNGPQSTNGPQNGWLNNDQSSQTSGIVSESFGDVLHPEKNSMFGLQNSTIQSGNGYNYPNNVIQCLKDISYDSYTSILPILDAHCSESGNTNDWFDMYVIPSNINKTGDCLLLIHTNVVESYAASMGVDISDVMGVHLNEIYGIVPDDLSSVYQYPSNCFINYQGCGVSLTSNANDYTNPDYVDSSGNETFAQWSGENTQRCSTATYKVKNAFNVRLEKRNIFIKNQNENPISALDSSSNWYSININMEGKSFSNSYVIPFFTSIADPNQPYEDSVVMPYNLGITSMANTNESVTGMQINENMTANISQYSNMININSILESNFGDIDSVSASNDFRIGMSYNPNSERGAFIHGFDANGRIHSNSSFSVSDNPNSSGRMNISFNSGTGLGLIDKEIILEDGADSLKEIKFNSVSLGKPSEVSQSIVDDVTTSIDLGKSNDTLQLDLNIHIKTTSEDSWIRGRLIKRGGQYFIHAGRIEGKEFTQISFEYDLNSSNVYGNHFINVVGTGTGATMNIFIRSEDPFNK